MKAYVASRNAEDWDDVHENARPSLIRTMNSNVKFTEFLDLRPVVLCRRVA